MGGFLTFKRISIPVMNLYCDIVNVTIPTHVETDTCENRNKQNNVNPLYFKRYLILWILRGPLKIRENKYLRNGWHYFGNVKFKFKFCVCEWVIVYFFAH